MLGQRLVQGGAEEFGGRLFECARPRSVEEVVGAGEDPLDARRPPLAPLLWGVVGRDERRPARGCGRPGRRRPDGFYRFAGFLLLRLVSWYR